MAYNGVEQVEADLRETRAHLDETLTELEHKLRPSHAVEAARDFVNREATRAGETIRAHPLATGLATMAAATALRRRSARRHRTDDAVAKLQALFDYGRATAQQTSRALGHDTRHLRSEAGHLAESVKHALRERADGLSHLDLAQVRRGIEQLESRPLLLAGAMLALGLFAGRLLRRHR